MTTSQVTQVKACWYTYLRCCPLDRDYAAMRLVVISFTLDIPSHSKVTNLINKGQSPQWYKRLMSTLSHGDDTFMWPLEWAQTYLASEFIIKENVPGSKVSVDKAFLGKVTHAISDVLRELDKHRWNDIRKLTIAHSMWRKKAKSD
jgi:hypothetical protein